MKAHDIIDQCNFCCWAMRSTVTIREAHNHHKSGSCEQKDKNYRKYGNFCLCNYLLAGKRNRQGMIYSEPMKTFITQNWKYFVVFNIPFFHYEFLCSIGICQSIVFIWNLFICDVYIFYNSRWFLMTANKETSKKYDEKNSF